MKKGFTLIELLAVIVILAIIALITIPIIADSISESREKSAIRAAELYVNSVEQALATRSIDGEFDLEDGCYNVNSSGNLEDSNNLEVLVVNAKNKPSSGTVCIEDLAVKRVEKLKLNNKEVTSSGDTYIVENSSTNTTPTKTYSAGEIVYFDVDEGKACTRADYEDSLGDYYYHEDNETHEDYGNSVSGYNGFDGENGQNSCLMFYVLHDDGNKVTLILDHNTTISVYWMNEKTNAQGPQTALAQLELDTADWNGTLTPTSYAYHRDANTCFRNGPRECSEVNYTIDYIGKKARLITAEEVLTLANVEYSNEVRTNIKGEYSSTGELTENIGWLYDRSNVYYYDFGMPNKSLNTSSDAYMVETGYWTATASNYVHDFDNEVFVVNAKGSLASTGVMDIEKSLRPVIEVSKNNL